MSGQVLNYIEMFSFKCPEQCCTTTMIHVSSKVKEQLKKRVLSNLCSSRKSTFPILVHNIRIGTSLKQEFYVFIWQWIVAIVRGFPLLA